MTNLSGHVVIVTGGGGALGAAVVESLWENGAKVVVPYVVAEEAPRLRAAAEKRGSPLLLVEADVGRSSEAAKVAAAAQDFGGRIDALVHLVGGFWGGKPIVETPEDEWDRMQHVNVKTLFLCARAVVPFMQRQRGGRIVAVASRAGFHGTGRIAAYSVAKGAVAHFVEALAEETRDDGISVNAIAPGTIDTPANRAAMPDADFTRWAPPAAIARVVTFLCSPAASLTSGAIVPVYGQS